VQWKKAFADTSSSTHRRVSQFFVVDEVIPDQTIFDNNETLLALGKSPIEQAIVAPPSLVFIADMGNWSTISEQSSAAESHRQ